MCGKYFLKMGTDPYWARLRVPSTSTVHWWGGLRPESARRVKWDAMRYWIHEICPMDCMASKIRVDAPIADLVSTELKTIP